MFYQRWTASFSGCLFILGQLKRYVHIPTFFSDLWWELLCPAINRSEGPPKLAVPGDDVGNYSHVTYGSGPLPTFPKMDG